MLPARQGDALWIEYGAARRPTRILIDAGTRGTYKVVKERAEQVAGEPVLELLVITHVDSDHVGGAPKLVVDGELRLQARHVWFNGREQLERRALGPVEGEILSAAIAKRGWQLNTCFPKKVAVVTGSTLPTVTLPGGMAITLLSPTPAGLKRLLPVWLDAVRDAGLLEGQAGALEEAARRRGVALGDRVPDVDALTAASPIDTAPANGSTIAFLAEYEGMSCLFGGDAHPDVLVTSIKKLLKDRGATRLELSGLKVPHHGSAHNVTEELTRLVHARKYLFSTDGTQTEHPDPPAVARILKSLRGEAELVFNYKTPFTEPWRNRALQTRFGYTAHYPPAGGAGIVAELQPL